CNKCTEWYTKIDKVKMKSSEIVEIDCALNQTHPKQSNIEIQVALRVAGDSSDVMKSGDSLPHRYHTVTMLTSTRESSPRDESVRLADFPTLIFSKRNHGPANVAFRVAVPMRSNAPIALTPASVAPIPMTHLKAYTKDSSIA